ncbi:MAG: hypothetical protein KBC81_01300 [Candidatus Pacebacteria bacterium]|nr:hypothetical protein [Candidatus Paceibacterota bacterium]
MTILEKGSFRSLKFFLKMRGIIQIKNRQLRERDDAIILLKRRIALLEQHRRVVSELSAKEVPVFGKTHRAGS